MPPGNNKGHDSTAEPASTVLIVDDDPSHRQLRATTLERVRFRTMEAGAAETALVLVPESDPDVIVMDVRMPGMDGLECSRRLRASDATACIPIIMATFTTRADTPIHAT